MLKLKASLFSFNVQVPLQTLVLTIIIIFSDLSFVCARTCSVQTAKFIYEDSAEGWRLS